MRNLESKIKKVLKDANFGTRKTEQVLQEFYNIDNIPCNIFIKYNSKKYVLDIVGYNPQTTSVKLMRPKKFIEYYGDFDIPESDWI